MWSESRIRSEVDPASRSFDPKSAPERSIAIGDPPCRKVSRRHAGDLSGHIPPVHLSFRFDSMAGQKLCDTEWNNDSRFVSCGYPLKGRQIQVVVMIVAKQNEVDLRHALERDSRRKETARPNPRERARSVTPDRVRE